MDVKAAMATSTRVPVIIPASWVCTPDALFTAVLVKDPVTGIDLTKEPIKLDIPKAISSWVTSKDLPFAAVNYKFS